MPSQHPAADFALPDTSGHVHRLEDFRREWLLLVFHRHLAWLPCREHVAQLRSHEKRIEQLGLNVRVVTFQARWLAEAYVRETKLRWPLLIDETRELYTAYGMARGRWRDILGPAAWWAYAKLLARGRRPKRTTGDVRQLGGDVLIDPEGMIRLHHIGRGPADRPPVEKILSLVEACVGS